MFSDSFRPSGGWWKGARGAAVARASPQGIGHLRQPRRLGDRSPLASNAVSVSLPIYCNSEPPLGAPRREGAGICAHPAGVQTPPGVSFIALFLSLVS